MRILALGSFLFLCGFASAQEEVPSPTDLAEEVVLCLDRLAERAGDPEGEQKALALLDAAIADILSTRGLIAEHYVLASSPLLHEHPARALRIAEAGLEQFAKSRPLWDHVGFANLVRAMGMVPSREQMKILEAANEAFTKAGALAPDTFHTHLGQAQAASLLGDQELALAALDRLARRTDAASLVPDLPLMRASVLLRADRAKEVPQLLAGVQAEHARAAAVLTLRAHALAGDVAAVQKAAKELIGGDADPLALLAAADALGHVGKRAEAMALLAKLPKRVAGAGEEAEGQRFAQAGAALEVLWDAKDWSSKGPLRNALTKALEHKFVVAGQKQGDLSASPRMMGSLLANKPLSAEKQWADDVLLVLCIHAAVGYQAKGLELAIAAAVAKQRMPDEADIEALRRARQWGLGDPESPAPLAGWRAVTQIETAAAKPDKQPTKR